MKASLIFTALRALVAARQPVFIWGGPGIGKSAVVRQLAEAMGVSETPIREAFMQLARVKGIEMKAARSLIVAELTLAQYLELRRIRLLLEGLAAEAATKNITDAAIKQMISQGKSEQESRLGHGRILLAIAVFLKTDQASPVSPTPAGARRPWDRA